MFTSGHWRSNKSRRLRPRRGFLPATAVATQRDKTSRSPRPGCHGLAVETPPSVMELLTQLTDARRTELELACRRQGLFADHQRAGQTPVARIQSAEPARKVDAKGRRIRRRRLRAVAKSVVEAWPGPVLRQRDHLKAPPLLRSPGQDVLGRLHAGKAPAAADRAGGQAGHYGHEPGQIGRAHVGTPVTEQS